MRVSVSYLPEQSEPERGRWFWAYHIRIENDGPQAVQLLTRHWIIIDGRGARHSVEGEGVVGEQPTLHFHLYGQPLETLSGRVAIDPDTGEVKNYNAAYFRPSEAVA